MMIYLVLDNAQFNPLYGSAVQDVFAEYTPQSENIPVAQQTQ